jgi:hypothetical protein
VVQTEASLGPAFDAEVCPTSCSLTLLEMR